MAKLSFFADNRRPDKFGRLPIRLLISNGTSTTTITTGVSTSPKFFIGEPTQVLTRTAPQAQDINRSLYNIYTKYFEVILDLERLNRLRYMTAADIRKVADERTALQTIGEKNTSDFIAFFKEYGASRNTAKTKKSYEYAEGVLREYCADRHLNPLPFSHVNYAMLTDFARWLRDTRRGESTRHMIECYIRAAYKEAEKRHIISRDNDPYFDYSIAPAPQKDIETLTADEVRALACARLFSVNNERARDVALMSFYLCGVNLLDLYEMDAPKNGEVVYIRHKTQRVNRREVHVRIEDELQALIDKYRGDNALLCFKSECSSYETFQRRITLHLRAISKEIGIDVTMAKIRRTWATIAGELDVPDLVINKSMGHIDNTINTRHYVEYKWSKTADANRMVIDYVLTGKCAKPTEIG